MAKDSLLKASTPEPFSRSKTSNWVARGGGLPPYVQHIAHDLVEKRGMDESKAIEMAIGIVKRWARGGGDVDANTRAAAAKALAEWEKLKASNRAKGGKVSEAPTGVLAMELSTEDIGDLSLLEADFDPAKHPRDRMGRWRDLVGKIQQLSTGDKGVKVGRSFHVHKIADSGSRKYRVTMKTRPGHDDQRVYVQTAADAADAALGISPAQAESQVRDLLGGRTAEQLKSDYREARRRELAGDSDANEARRQITVQLVRKLGRDATGAFERSERAKEKRR